MSSLGSPEKGSRDVFPQKAKKDLHSVLDNLFTKRRAERDALRAEMERRMRIDEEIRAKEREELGRRRRSLTDIKPRRADDHLLSDPLFKSYIGRDGKRYDSYEALVAANEAYLRRFQRSTTSPFERDLGTWPTKPDFPEKIDTDPLALRQAEVALKSEELTKPVKAHAAFGDIDPLTGIVYRPDGTWWAGTSSVRETMKDYARDLLGARPSERQADPSAK